MGSSVTYMLGEVRHQPRAFGHGMEIMYRGFELLRVYKNGRVLCPEYEERGQDWLEYNPPKSITTRVSILSSIKTLNNPRTSQAYHHSKLQAFHCPSSHYPTQWSQTLNTRRSTDLFCTCYITQKPESQKNRKPSLLSVTAPLGGPFHKRQLRSMT